MAIDTRSRRASVLGVAIAVALTLPLADGALGTEDRAHVAFCYPGVIGPVASADVIVTAVSDDTVVRVGADDLVCVVPADDEVMKA